MTKQKDIFLLYFLLLIEFLVLLNSKTVIKSVLSSSSMFVSSIFPSLFPTMVIGLNLIKYGVDKIVPKFIKNIFKVLFDFDAVSSTIFITSMIAGTPSNAVFINDYLTRGLISEKNAENLLCCTHFVNPLFVVGGVGVGVFNSAKIGFLILLMTYASNLIKAFILRKNFEQKNVKDDNTISNSFIQNLQTAILSCVKSLLLILGIVIMFNVLVTLLSSIFNFNNVTSCLVNGLLEMTSGIMKLKSINITTPVKIMMAYYFLSFGGLCIQMQAFSMITKIKIRYIKYLIFRII